MAEPEGIGAAESTGEFQAPVDGEVSEAANELGDVDENDGSEEEQAEAEEASAQSEPPRRRVSELLEGQEVFEETTTRPDLQIVAPPLHLESSDAGQPFYQLDLSSDEPEGTFVEPERLAGESVEVVDPALADGASGELTVGDTSALPFDDVHEVVKRMILQRDRQVMAAERDGIGAYELAVGVDNFVYRLVEAVRNAD
jgi:hypothetical protein